MERPLAKMYQINLAGDKEPFKYSRPNLQFWLVPTGRQPEFFLVLHKSLYATAKLVIRIGTTNLKIFRPTEFIQTF